MEKVYSFIHKNFGEFAPGISKDDMDQRIIVDNIPVEYKEKIIDDYKELFGGLGFDMNVEDLLNASNQFSKKMQDDLPFLRYKNLNETRATHADQRAIFYEYLKLLESGNVKLSQLINSSLLDCTGETLLLMEALKDWKLYHGISESGTMRAHTFLAKEFEIGDKKYVAIIDPTELDLYRHSTMPHGICSSYIKSHGLVLPVEEFERIGYVLDPINEVSE
ncbi:MAG: hypothetical protein ABIF85_03645 [Nanoarchaeota archaeon]|nr:hypothetical protein [Nanoarchaeota archaeon]